MKRFTYITIILLSFIILNNQCAYAAAAKTQADAKNAIEYRLAQMQDIPGMLALIETQAVADSDKIVILPKKFRADSLANAVKSGKMFIAVQPGSAENASCVVAFKKLYCLNAKELDEVLKTELRLKDASVMSAMVDPKSLKIDKENKADQELQHVLASKTTYIYNGGDLTDAKFRKRGINTQLMRAALNQLEKSVVENIAQNSSSHVALVFGLAKSNTGNGILQGRSEGLVRSFAQFSHRIAVQGSSILCGRYTAFMPTFDPESAECRPKPDDQSVQGFGCIMAVPLQSVQSHNSAILK